ncbi:hypothetical protein B23_3378 [Geobacillus thermoleovorans B23]|nr:hypothetical protein B23_3378 [Geobacillus thermoleovorans B23]
MENGTSIHNRQRAGKKTTFSIYIARQTSHTNR